MSKTVTIEKDLKKEIVKVGFNILFFCLLIFSPLCELQIGRPFLYMISWMFYFMFVQPDFTKLIDPEYINIISFPYISLGIFGILDNP